MKKSLIALAIAAALPVAAQADATISGSVNSVYTQGDVAEVAAKPAKDGFAAVAAVAAKPSGAIDTDVTLKLNTSEVLANGMTATAEFGILGSSPSTGTVSLAGDFGTFTAGSMDSDGAFQAGDAGSIVGDTMTADETGTTVQGIKYASGDMSGFGLTVQMNGSTEADGSTTTKANKSTQVGLTYAAAEGLTLGYGSATADADNQVGGGVNGKTNVVGGTYTTGDYEFTLGKQKDMGAKGSVQYVYDAVTVKLSASQAKGTVAASNTLKVTYVEDGVTANVEKVKGKDTTWDIAYATGDLTLKAKSTKVYTAALDYGNVDLTLTRDTDDKTTSVGYKVAF